MIGQEEAISTSVANSRCSTTVCMELKTFPLDSKVRSLVEMEACRLTCTRCIRTLEETTHSNQALARVV